MSSVSASGRSSVKTIITIVLVVIAVLAIVAGIIYFIEPAHSLPTFMGKITHPPAGLNRANATRSLRGAGRRRPARDSGTAGGVHGIAAAVRGGALVAPVDEEGGHEADHADHQGAGAPQGARRVGPG